MFKIIAAVVIGGSRSFWGPVIGLVVLTVIEEALTGANQLVPLFWGLIIIGTVLFIPSGLESLARRLLLRLSGKAMLQSGYQGGKDASRA